MGQAMKNKSDYESMTNEQKIAQALEYYSEDLAYEQTQRNLMMFDTKFANGLNHWEGQAYDTRQFESRPMLTIPRMNEFLNKVKNEQRQNKASIKVSPCGAISETIKEQREKSAEYRQGLIRHIQNTSKATEAYQTAFDSAVETGRGFFLIKTDWVGKTYNQRIEIERIADALSVVCDRNRKELDYSDMQHAFIVERISRKIFDKKYPNATQSQWVSSDVNTGWATSDDLLVANYYCIHHYDRTIYAMEDGATFFDDELDDFPPEIAKEIRANYVDTREYQQPFVKMLKMTSSEILEEKDIVGEYIPIVPIVIVEKEIDGQLLIKGMVRDLKDSQLLYDYWSSTEAELLSLSPKAPYMIADGQMEGYEKYWESANTKAWSALPYKPMSLSGAMVPPPIRTDMVGVPSGIVNAKMGTVDDMRAITGIHEQSLGMNNGDTTAWRAITAMQQTSETATYHYVDAMRIGVTQAGRIINQWLPLIYDTHRIEKILGEDETESTIELGGKDENGMDIELGDGEFDVVVTMGASYATKRQENADMLFKFMDKAPTSTPLIWDIVAKNLDFSDAPELSARLKKTIPPEMLETTGNEQVMQQQMAEMDSKCKQYEQMIPLLQTQLERALSELEDNGNALAKDIQIQKMKSVTDIEVAKIRANTENSKNLTNFIHNIQTARIQNQTNNHR